MKEESFIKCPFCGSKNVKDIDRQELIKEGDKIIGMTIPFHCDNCEKYFDFEINVSSICYIK